MSDMYLESERVAELERALESVRAERDRYAAELDELAGLVESSADSRARRLADRALALLAEGARLQSRDGGGPDERDYILRRAELLAELGITPPSVDEYRRAYAEWASRDGHR